ncbi:flagellar hook-length control protein FliK [Enterocloster sp. OA13]|uniref:flagellar hook-length control protein FliK n=1 Tax=Enterocloster sp. OA13 TaxID=2914161 RepID=UPI00046F02BC|nr:flagellar hook-length control protein FliK [Enterocloster sp. OA13]
MERMDLTQMVRQAVQTADSGVSPNRDKEDDRSGGDFLQMLRGRQQALDRRDREERLSKKDGSGGKKKPAVKQEDGAEGQESGQGLLEATKAGAGDILKGFTLQFRLDQGQLTREWDAAVLESHHTGSRMPLQDPVVLEGAGNEPVKEPRQALPDYTVSWPEIRTDMEQQIPDMGKSPAGQAVGQLQALGKEEPFPVPVAEKSRNQEEPVRVKTMDGLTRPVTQEHGPQQSVSDAPVKAQTQDRTGANEQPEKELPLAHAVDSRPMVSNQDFGTVGQAEAQSPVRTTMEELPEAFAKALADRMPDNNGTLTIEFEPASLGKVTLRVIYEAGRTSVSLMSDNPKTLEILSQNAGQIAGILEDKTGRETVIYTYQPQQQFADRRESGREGRREPGNQKSDRRREQRDSFAQQLRLGLV